MLSQHLRTLPQFYHRHLMWTLSVWTATSPGTMTQGTWKWFGCNWIPSSRTGMERTKSPSSRASTALKPCLASTVWVCDRVFPAWGLIQLHILPLQAPLQWMGAADMAFTLSPVFPHACRTLLWCSPKNTRLRCWRSITPSWTKRGKNMWLGSSSGILPTLWQIKVEPHRIKASSPKGAFFILA